MSESEHSPDAAATLAPARAVPRIRAVPWFAVALALLALVLPFLEGVPLIGWLASPFQRIQLTYGLVFGIAALAFNLLLGYTGLLSFGHAVFFGSAAYATGLLVKYLHVSSMEGFLLAGFFICMVALGMIAASPFGKALQAIRDNEIRAQFVGIEVWRYRWSAFVVSGAFTGVAGTLFAPLNGLTTPDILHWTFSGKIVFMTVLGGFKSFSGPILGGVAYNYLETYVIKTTEYWQMLLGIILVALVLIMPQGIIGALGWLVHRRSGRRGAATVARPGPA